MLYGNARVRKYVIQTNEVMGGEYLFEIGILRKEFPFLKKFLCKKEK